jgi:hypothetical protein
MGGQPVASTFLGMILRPACHPQGGVPAMDPSDELPVCGHHLQLSAIDALDPSGLQPILLSIVKTLGEPGL